VPEAPRDVITDHERAEVGATWMQLTAAGQENPVFGPMSERFQAISGHEDIVTALPTEATLLASSELGRNEAFCFSDKPIYCTQFHPELNRESLLDRMRKYPAYIPLAGASTLEELAAMTPETTEAEGILHRFMDEAVAAI
jgi:GMP synthase (glutamine-hydrolysing)